MHGRGPTAHWKGEDAMRFIEETGFCVRVGREEAFQKWLVANEERIAAAYPPGASYIGTFVTAFTSEKNAGRYRVLEGLDSYAALDAAAAAQKDPNSAYAKAWREAMQFMDPDPKADWSQTLLKSVVDATIWDVAPED